MIHFPRISLEQREFSLDWRLPAEYEDWTKAITPDFREVMEKRAKLVHTKFNLDNQYGSYPTLLWDDKRGLAGVVVGHGCPCARINETSMHSYSFHNVSTPIQALALLQTLSVYLNGLQKLKEGS